MLAAQWQVQQSQLQRLESRQAGWLARLSLKYHAGLLEAYDLGG